MTRLNFRIEKHTQYLLIYQYGWFLEAKFCLFLTFLILLITIFTLSSSTIPILIAFLIMTSILYIPRTEIELNAERKMIIKRIVMKYFSKKIKEILIPFKNIKQLKYSRDPYNISVILVDSLTEIMIFKENKAFSMDNVASWKLCKEGCNRIVQTHLNGSEMMVSEYIQLWDYKLHPFMSQHFWEDRKMNILYCIDYGIQNIENLSASWKIIELEALFLTENSISSIKEYEFLNAVKILILDRNKISDLNGINNYKKLEFISASENRIALMDSIKDLQNLIIVDLSFNQIKKIPIIFSPKLRVLALSGNNILIMEGLSQLVNLEELYLDQNQIIKITELNKLEKLKIISLDNNKLTSLIGLENLRNLEELSLSNNTISKIGNIQSADNLRIIDFSNNQIICIEGINSLKNLEEIYLGFNKISKIENIDRLKNLRELHLSNNRISTIDGLEALSQLVFLNLSSNKITSINGLERLINLKELDLTDNLLTYICGLENLSKLERLRLSGNNLPQDLLDKLGGLDFLGYAKEPQKFIEYCRKNLKNNINDIKQEIGLSLPIHRETTSLYSQIQKIKKESIILHRHVKY